jgi:hypothetical protein
MQSDPGTSELSQVFDANSRRVDFDPPWLNGGRIVIEFEPLLPTERQWSIC